MVHDILQPFLFDCPYEEIHLADFLDRGLYRPDIPVWSEEKNLFDFGTSWDRQVALSWMEANIGPKPDFDAFVERVKPLDRLFLVDDRKHCLNPMWRKCADTALRSWLWWMNEEKVRVVLVSRDHDNHHRNAHASTSGVEPPAALTRTRVATGRRSGTGKSSRPFGRTET